MTNVNVKSNESSRRLLRYSRWCALIPGALGVSAVLGWLAVGGLMDDVAPFYFLGILAIGLGLLLLPVGLGLVLVAFRRGASVRSVVLSVFILLGNLPLAVACWKTAGSLLDLQIIRIVNSSDDVVGPVRVWIEPERAVGHALEIAALQAGESRTWALHYSSEGLATFRAQQGARIIEHEGGIFLGIGQPMEVLLEFEDNGQHKLEGVSARRWFWLEALRN